MTDVWHGALQSRGGSRGSREPLSTDEWHVSVKPWSSRSDDPGRPQPVLVLVRAVAELTGAGITPAVAHAAGGHPAGVAVAGVHLAEWKPARDRHRRVAIGLGAVAQRAFAVEPPAIGPIVRSCAAGMLAARVHE